MKTYKRSNEIVTHLVAISFFIIGTLVSARSVLHGWVGLLFVPAYVIGFLVVLTTSIVIICRDPYFRFKIFLISSTFAFALSSFLIVGDNGDSSGAFYQEQEYSSYDRVSEGMQPLPSIPRHFSGLGFFGFFIAGNLALIFMIAFSCSAKRKGTLG